MVGFLEYVFEGKKKIFPDLYVIQSNLVIRNFLVTLKRQKFPIPYEVIGIWSREMVP